MNAQPRQRWFTWRRLLLVLAVLVLGPPLLFVLNGTLLSAGETPVVGTTSHPGAPLPAAGAEIRILTFNIAKGFLHLGGTKFQPREKEQAVVDEIGRVVAAEKPDIVFLSEAVKECSPCPIDQIVLIANAAGLHHWVFGENYNFGLPFLRILGGNAILSRFELEPVANIPLAGRQPFWVTKNNRRVLFCRLNLPTGPVLLGALHTDSYQLANNCRQMQQILAYVGTRPTILAGDFNAEPKDDSLRAVVATQLFSGEIDGPPSFPADKPRERIDFVLAPRAWEHLQTRVIETTVSDHRPVVATFRIR